MVSAAEAKDLYTASGAEAEAYLNTHVDPLVQKAAASGSRWIHVFFGSYECGFRAHEASPLEKLIMERLKALGYTVKWEPAYGDKYVPRGLADGDGKGPSYVNYGMTVGW